tara:strand:- start:140 stop:319 length:180 start_codon:yes stop_codon:yes gene_type:complete
MDNIIRTMDHLLDEIAIKKADEFESEAESFLNKLNTNYEIEMVHEVDRKVTCLISIPQS